MCGRAWQAPAVGGWGGRLVGRRLVRRWGWGWGGTFWGGWVGLWTTGLGQNLQLVAKLRQNTPWDASNHSIDDSFDSSFVKRLLASHQTTSFDGMAGSQGARSACPATMPNTHPR